jgi:hypothetical protein
VEKIVLVLPFIISYFSIGKPVEYMKLATGMLALRRLGDSR